jgi:hypothetical protein
MQIVVRTFDGKALMFEANGDTLIDEIQAMIQDRVGMPIISQTLKHCSFTLESGMTLADYGTIHNLDTLHLSLKEEKVD